MARKKNYDGDTKVGTLEEYRSLPDGDAELLPQPEGDLPLPLFESEDPKGDSTGDGAAQDAVGAATVSSGGAKRTRRPLLSSEVNKAERELQRFDDRVKAFHATAARHAAQLELERKDFIASLPVPVETSLRLMGLIE